MDGAAPKVWVRTAAAVAAAGLLLGVSACGGSNDSAESTSAKVVKKEAGIAKPTNLKVVNRSGRPIEIDICHDGYCIGNKTLKDGESDQAAGDNIYGWIKYTWGMGNGNQQNQYTGVMGSAPGPYQINFTAGNPGIGLPWIEASHPNQCYYGYHYNGPPTGGYSSYYQGSARWQLGVDDVAQSPGNRLCTYSLVGSRQPDGGADRVTGAPADYKMLTLEAYAPDPVYLSDGCTWEHTPGPVVLPQSPDGSWSCWKPGPKPPSDTAVTYTRVE